jgi:hypothetical protein
MKKTEMLFPWVLALASVLQFYESLQSFGTWRINTLLGVLNVVGSSLLVTGAIYILVSRARHRALYLLAAGWLIQVVIVILR